MMQLTQVKQQFRFLLWILMVQQAISTTVESFIFTNGFTGTKLRMDGIASITENGVLRLTNNTEQSTGHAIYPTPLHFLQPSTGKAVSFSTTFVFAMIPQDPVYYGHGMAFFISPTTNFSTAMASQWLGLFNVSDNGDSSDHIVAVELDTVLNAEYDIDSNHLGIDINNLKSNLSHHAGYFDDFTGEFHNLSLVSGEPMQVWVDYDGGEMKLNVAISPIQMLKPRRPLLSLVVNLSSILLDPMFIGFASSTGTVVASHNLLGWSFKMNGAAEALNLSALPSLLEVVPLNDKGKRWYLTTWLPAVVSIVLFIGIAVVIIFMLRRIKFSKLLEDWELQYGPHRFSYKTLITATNGFNDKLILGAGGFGRVYKGVLLKCNTEIAVKKVSHESNQGMTEFVSEIITLGQLRHRNLVRLLGYCRHKGELLLVYEFMRNGSLDKFLYHQAKPTLNWAQRFHIIKGVASGIEYLHQNSVKVVIHRDIKTSNVLLDSELNGRLGDFGLARLCDHNTDPTTTKVAGTFGYMAPELSRTGRPTTLTDVFAFGVLMLEVACGRKPIDPYKEEANQISLMDWVAENWQKGTILETIDSRLEDEGYTVCEIELVLKLGLLCSHPLPESRPSMRQVVQYLNGDAQLPPLSLAYLSFQVLALQQNAGIDLYPISDTIDSFVQSGDQPSEIIAEPYSDESFHCRV
ncbi:putative protein kinase RLK-Pelle-L-LEC family [Dioscorea sansibarensis]